MENKYITQEEVFKTIKLKYLGHGDINEIHYNIWKERTHAWYKIYLNKNDDRDVYTDLQQDLDSDSPTDLF